MSSTTIIMVNQRSLMHESALHRLQKVFKEACREYRLFHGHFTALKDTYARASLNMVNSEPCRVGRMAIDSQLPSPHGGKPRTYKDRTQSKMVTYERGSYRGFHTLDRLRNLNGQG
jgi:hypothetical protein